MGLGLGSGGGWMGSCGVSRLRWGTPRLRVPRGPTCPNRDPHRPCDQRPSERSTPSQPPTSSARQAKLRWNHRRSARVLSQRRYRAPTGQRSSAVAVQTGGPRPTHTLLHLPFLPRPGQAPQLQCAARGGTLPGGVEGTRPGRAGTQHPAVACILMEIACPTVPPSHVCCCHSPAQTIKPAAGRCLPACLAALKVRGQGTCVARRRQLGAGAPWYAHSPCAPTSSVPAPTHASPPAVQGGCTAGPGRWGRRERPQEAQGWVLGRGRCLRSGQAGARCRSGTGRSTC